MSDRMTQKDTQEDKKRGLRVDAGLDKDVESFREEMHMSAWSEAARQLIVKGLRTHEKEKREQKYS